jgi:hypothetical protein
MYSSAVLVYLIMIQDQEFKVMGFWGHGKFGGGGREDKRLFSHQLVTRASLKNERRHERWDNTTSRHEKRHEMTPEKRAIFGGFLGGLKRGQKMAFFEVRATRSRCVERVKFVVHEQIL